jgi:hypothetical protein
MPVCVVEAEILVYTAEPCAQPEIPQSNTRAQQDRATRPPFQRLGNLVVGMERRSSCEHSGFEYPSSAAAEWHTRSIETATQW